MNEQLKPDVSIEDQKMSDVDRYEMSDVRQSSTWVEIDYERRDAREIGK